MLPVGEIQDRAVAEGVAFLRERAMLEAVRPYAARAIATGRMWQRPYAAPQPRAAAARAPAWFTAYPAAVMTPPGRSVLGTLGDPRLWDAFAAMGIRALHTGPVKEAGGLAGRMATPTVDGHFDRIGIGIDPAFGTEDEVRAIVATAGAHGGILIDDIVPGHTGKGADFRLAELAYGDYPGLYHMVEIPPEEWHLLPPVPDDRDSVNLPAAVVDELARRGLVVGQLQRTIFFEPGVKETDWSTTGVVRGVDGVERRWVYLHYFKDGQPTLNWLDPTFAAARLVVGDALHALDGLGAGMLRLDANGFLGIEPGGAAGRAWSEGHPLSVTANALIAGMVRKAGGFTFQELNLAVDDIARMAQGGADLSYDFVERPAIQHALLTGDAGFLRLMIGELRTHGIDPAALVHGLQNHDELTLELVHLWTAHADDEFSLGGRTLTGSQLRDEVRETMYARLTGPAAPYNLRFVTNGVACTTASIAAAALGITDIGRLGRDEVEAIRGAHLALAMANALQPGVFALSGWDIVGALPLPREAVAQFTGDGDTRWINRGAYDLLGDAGDAAASAAGMPRAEALYGPLPAQLADDGSFASRLGRILAARERSGLFAARLLAVPETEHPGLLVLVHELPGGATQVTALNLGTDPVRELVPVGGAHAGDAEDMLGGPAAAALPGRLELELPVHGGASYLVP